jgi:hypothetical protein
MTSRIYNQVDYGSNFQGSAKEESFTKVEALDQSQAIKKRAAQKVENIGNLAKAAQLQGTLDQATLSGNQKIAGAKLAHNQKMVQGFLSLTKTGLELYGKVEEARKQGQKTQSILDSIGFGNEPFVVDETQVEANKIDDQNISIESKTVNEISTELNSTGNIEDKALSHQLQEDTTFNKLKGIKNSPASAAAIHSAYLKERLRKIPDNEKPRGIAEAQILINQFNRDFLNATGLNDPRFIDQILVDLAPIMQGNNRNFLATTVEAGIKADQKANLEGVKADVATFFDNKKDANYIWTESYKKFLDSNVGYTGDSAELNQKVLETILEEASLAGPHGQTVIRDLRKVLKRPGIKNTELEKQYEHIFDKYEKQAKTNAVNDYTLNQRKKTADRQIIIDDYYENPSAENKLKAIEALKKQKTAESIALANKLASTGLNYDPNKATELAIEQAKGNELDEDMLRKLLDENTISADEYKQLKESGPLRQSKKELDETLNSTQMQKAILSSLVQGVPEKLQNSELKRQAGVRLIAIQDDLRDAVLAELRVNPNLIGDKKELARVIEEKLKNLLNQPQYKAKESPDAGKRLHFPEPISNKQNLATITVPGKVGVEDYSTLSHDQLFNQAKFSIGEMNPTKDYFFKVDDLKVELTRFKTDGHGSKRLQDLAQSMGYSPKAFLNAQMRLYGKPNINKVNIKGIEAPTSFNNLNDGFKYLVGEGGLPWRGSAYLAANIEALTGWNFNLDDKGQLSVAPWMESPARVKNLEAAFGKPMDSNTIGEQLNYMLLEMKRDYPESYRVFMDPQASSLALTKATYNYFGFGMGDAQDVANINGKITGLLNKRPD